MEFRPDTGVCGINKKKKKINSQKGRRGKEREGRVLKLTHIE